jgi:hypothetical protein
VLLVELHHRGLLLLGVALVLLLQLRELGRETSLLVHGAPAEHELELEERRQQDFDQDGEKDDRQPIGADGGDQWVRGQQVVEITQSPADGVAEDRPPEQVNGEKEVEKLAQGFYC